MESRDFGPVAVGVVTERSVTRFAAHHLRPTRSRAAIADARAVRAMSDAAIEPLRIAMPAIPGVEFVTAAGTRWVRGVGRTGTRSLRIRSLLIAGDASSMMYSSFVELTRITRQAVGRWTRRP